MDTNEWLADRFEEHRPRLRAVAYRMLGSYAEAEDAVQDTWLRLSRSGSDVENLGAWLTTVTARICLNALRSRDRRREEPYDAHVPDPYVSDGLGPDDEAVLADSVGLALLVVLDTLAPAERLAFVLHDMFDVPYDEIAAMVDRSPDAARQLASRARRRVRGAGVAAPDPDLSRQREVVDAFLAAARDGDFETLVSVLDPDVTLRIDAGLGRRASMTIHGAAAVAEQTRSGATGLARFVVRPAIVSGTPGFVATRKGRRVAVVGFTVADGKIVEIDTILDPVRLDKIAEVIG